MASYRVRHDDDEDKRNDDEYLKPGKRLTLKNSRGGAKTAVSAKTSVYQEEKEYGERNGQGGLKLKNRFSTNTRPKTAKPSAVATSPVYHEQLEGSRSDDRDGEVGFESPEHSPQTPSFAKAESVPLPGSRSDSSDYEDEEEQLDEDIKQKDDVNDTSGIRRNLFKGTIVLIAILSVGSIMFPFASTPVVSSLVDTLDSFTSSMTPLRYQYLRGALDDVHSVLDPIIRDLAYAHTDQMNSTELRKNLRAKRVEIRATAEDVKSRYRWLTRYYGDGFLTSAQSLLDNVAVMAKFLPADLPPANESAMLVGPIATSLHPDKDPYSLAQGVLRHQAQTMFHISEQAAYKSHALVKQLEMTISLIDTTTHKYKERPPSPGFPRKFISTNYEHLKFVTNDMRASTRYLESMQKAARKLEKDLHSQYALARNLPSSCPEGKCLPSREEIFGLVRTKQAQLQKDQADMDALPVTDWTLAKTHEPRRLRQWIRHELSESWRLPLVRKPYVPTWSTWQKNGAKDDSLGRCSWSSFGQTCVIEREWDAFKEDEFVSAEPLNDHDSEQDSLHKREILQGVDEERNLDKKSTWMFWT